MQKDPYWFEWAKEFRRPQPLHARAQALLFLPPAMFFLAVFCFAMRDEHPSWWMIAGGLFIAAWLLKAYIMVKYTRPARTQTNPTDV